MSDKIATAIEQINSREKPKKKQRRTRERPDKDHRNENPRRDKDGKCTRRKGSI